jgi:hypothetical protein
LARSAKVAGLEARLAAEFRADWSDRQKALDLALRQSSSALALKGLSRSSALLHERTRILEQALDDARTMLIRRASVLLAPTARRTQEEGIGRLRAVVAAELTRLATGFDELLTREAASMGIGTNLGQNVQSKRKALLTTLETDLSSAVTAARQAAIPTPLPWYQRPFGIVLLSLIGGLLVWFLSTKVFGG